MNTQSADTIEYARPPPVRRSRLTPVAWSFAFISAALVLTPVVHLAIHMKPPGAVLVGVALAGAPVGAITGIVVGLYGWLNEPRGYRGWATCAVVANLMILLVLAVGAGAYYSLRPSAHPRGGGFHAGP